VPADGQFDFVTIQERGGSLANRVRILGYLVVSCLATTAQGQTVAQANFPTKPMRLLVGFVPGGFTDLAGRIVGQGLSEAFGMQVIVENRAGANGAIAAELTARATPDGYTFYMASPGHTTNPILQTKARSDPIKDFTPLSLFAHIPNVLVVNPTVPARTVKEFLTLARNSRLTLTQASSGVGSPGHLIGELLQMRTKVKFTHVPYKGSGAMISDLVSGQVDFSFPSTAAALPHVTQGRLRALGVASAKRSQAYPDVPTIAEAAVPGFEVMGWYGVLGPARMPREIAATLSSEIMRLARKSDVRSRLQKAGAEPVGNTSEEFAAFIASEYDKWSNVIKAANIKSR
jgi:tripartite-type tricarboxylate transporter receptor subunit TctC